MENKRPELESCLIFWKSVTVRCRAHFPNNHFKGLMLQETLNLLFKASLFLTKVNHCSLDFHTISLASGKILITKFFHHNNKHFCLMIRTEKRPLNLFFFPRTESSFHKKVSNEILKIIFTGIKSKPGKVTNHLL